MSTTKKFIVSFNDDNQVTLEVNTEKLTPALATEINKFWGSDSLRLSEQHNDVVEVVVRLFGAAAIRVLMESGGIFHLSQPKANEYWTRKVLEEQQEGWPEFESLGILIVDAEISCIEYFGVTLEEVAQ
jgi:hypothetical protein